MIILQIIPMESRLTVFTEIWGRWHATWYALTSTANKTLNLLVSRFNEALLVYMVCVRGKFFI